MLGLLAAFAEKLNAAFWDGARLLTDA